MRKLVISGLIAILTPAVLFGGELKDENLLQTMPEGFKQGWSTSHDGMDMAEFVAAHETVDTWTRLITTQIFHGKGEMPSGAFLQQWGGRMGNACPGLTHSQLTTGHRNGYTGSFVQIDCPLNPQTKKPEYVFIEDFQGKDALYVIQYAFRYEPSAAEIENAMSFMRAAIICDTRTKEHPCPDLATQGFKKIAP